MHDAHDFFFDLVAAHKDVRVVLSEATNSEQAVKRALKLVTVHEPQFAHSHRKLFVAVRLGAVNHNSARAVHRFDAINFVVDDGGIHIVL